MIVGTPSNWSKGASELLKQFLETTTGHLFLAHLAASRPSLSAGTDLAEVALAASYARGHEHAIEKISQLCEPPVEDANAGVSDLYPPIEDDTKWEGEKLNPS